MKQSFWQRLDHVAKSLMPFAITFFLVMLGMVPLRIPNVSPVLPSLVLIAIYYWAVHRPDLMSIWAVFLLGLFQDLVSGSLVGVGTMVLLVVFGVVGSQRRFLASASFMLIWFVFIVVAAGALTLEWAMVSLLQGQVIGSEPAVFQYLMTIAVYPCLAWLFAQAQRAFLR